MRTNVSWFGAVRICDNFTRVCLSCDSAYCALEYTKKLSLGWAELGNRILVYAAWQNSVECAIHRTDTLVS